MYGYMHFDFFQIASNQGEVNDCFIIKILSYSTV